MALQTINLPDNVDRVPPRDSATEFGDSWYSFMNKVKTMFTEVYSAAITGLTATVTEINRVADVSTRLVPGGSSLVLTEAAHESRTILLDTAGGTTLTLPAASGGGGRYRVEVSVLATSNSHIVKVANTADAIQGAIVMVSTTASATTFFASNATSDTITLNRTTTGSVTKGEWMEFQDTATNVWTVHGILTNSGTGSTPFSSTV